VSEDEFTSQILVFFRENFPPDDETPHVDEATPLDGILDSLKTAILLNYLRDGLGTPVPPALIDARNFRSIRTIAAMAHGLAAASTR
jgi:acyl carrier protein